MASGIGKLTSDFSRRDALRAHCLSYFNGENGSPTLGMYAKPPFNQYEEREVKTMIYGLDAVGLIFNINGLSTSGRRYKTTRLGRELMRILGIPVEYDG